MVKIGSDRNHPWMLHWGGNFDEEQDTCVIINVPPQISDQLQGKHDNYTLKKSGITLTKKFKRGLRAWRTEFLILINFNSKQAHIASGYLTGQCTIDSLLPLNVNQPSVFTSFRANSWEQGPDLPSSYHSSFHTPPLLWDPPVLISA